MTDLDITTETFTLEELLEGGAMADVHTLRDRMLVHLDGKPGGQGLIAIAMLIAAMSEGNVGTASTSVGIVMALTNEFMQMQQDGRATPPGAGMVRH